MNIVYRYLDIVCRSASGEEIKLYADDYDECIDEIKIRTSVCNKNLNRGWIGDLTYSTKSAYDIESYTDVENVAQSTYHDVLLAHVTPYNMDEGVITWEYRFLKK
jgi:hypothetical protein